MKAQTFKPKLFFANPWAIAFKHNSNDGYVVSEASDVLVKITLDANNEAAMADPFVYDAGNVDEFAKIF